jgi:hypothetical protein
VGLRILMVDDDPASIESLRAELARIPETIVRVVDFDGFHEGVAELAPNIIVLDLARGSLGDNDVPGVGTFEEIWHHQFCPLVIYSAFPQVLEEDARLPHPFVKLEEKGSGSEERVIARIREFEPHLSALDRAGIEIERVLNQALKDVAPRGFSDY